MRLVESGLALEVRFLRKQPAQWLIESTSSSQFEARADKNVADGYQK